MKKFLRYAKYTIDSIVSISWVWLFIDMVPPEQRLEYTGLMWITTILAYIVVSIEIDRKFFGGSW